MTLETRKFFEEVGVDAAALEIVLLDVGASGGINNDWRQFEPYFSAVGVDAIATEVERLNAQEENSKVEYRAAYVVWPEWDEKFPKEERLIINNGSFERTSAVLDRETHKARYAQEVYNQGEPVRYAKEEVTIDQLAAEHPTGGFDVIKTDTDGYDFPALLGGEKTLSDPRTLFLKVEANFHGSMGPYANNFANIDTYLRSKGFSLIDIEAYRYSKRALPDQYVYSITAQTHSGTVQWSDAYYARDFRNPRFERYAGWAPTEQHIIKMAMLFEYAGHPDSTVELLLHFRDSLSFGDQLEILLDRIVQRYRDPKFGSTYQELISNFQEDYTRFYPEKRD